MTNRYFTIKAAQAKAHRSRLESAAEDMREVARQFGVKIMFFGSFVEGHVDGRSDLDVAIPDGLKIEDRRRLEEALERKAASQGICVDTISLSRAEALGAALAS